MGEFSVESILETFSSIFPNETSYAIADQEYFIDYKPSPVIDLRIKPGDEIRRGSATYKALTARRKVFSYIEPNVFGVSYYGLSVPIINQEDIRGCVTAIFPIKMKSPSLKFLTIKNEECWYPLPLHEIIYLEAVNRKAKVVGKKRSGVHKHNLSTLENLLPDDMFIRCHRSFIVNVNEILEIQPDFHSTFLLIMKNGDRIPVSQSYASTFRKLFVF